MKLASLGIALALLGVAAAQQHSTRGPAVDTSHWRTFTNRAGWSIRYPKGLKVDSCRQCSDPTDPGVFVAFLNPSTQVLMMVEPLADKPGGYTLDQWLDEVSRTANLNPVVSTEWIILDHTRALKVINRAGDSRESENIYVVRDPKTFAISGSDRATPSQEAVFRQMLATFRFTQP